MSNPTSQGGTWSQFDEDVWIAGLVESLPGIPHTLVEIGCGDGSENNTRLLLEQGWRGQWFDASKENVERARSVNPWTFCHRVKVETMVGLDAILEGRDFGVLSIDVDGNDWHLWKRSGELGWRPWIVVIESNISYKAHDEPWVMPYNPDHEWDHVSGEFGASVFSMIELGKELGYRYVGKPANPHSPNLFFVRDDLPQ